MKCGRIRTIRKCKVGRLGSYDAISSQDESLLGIRENLSDKVLRQTG